MNGCRWGGALVLAIAGAAALAAAGKPPKAVSIPVRAEFRCFQGGEPCDEDGVVADQDAYEYFVSMRSGGLNITAGAFINTAGSFNLRIYPGVPPGSARYLRIDRGASTDGFPCASIDNCNPASLPTGALDLNDIHMVAKPLVFGTDDDLPGGLTAMACSGQNYEAIVHFTFPYPETTGHWGLNFNPRSPAGSSTFAAIRRTAQRSWTVEATPDDRAGLLGFAHTGIQGKNGPSQEGTYIVPFLLTITMIEDVSVPSCP